MSNYQKGDIVEFINENGLCEFGMIISVQISDTISAIVVSGFEPKYPKWISTERVKNHWKNLKGYILDIDLLKAENERLKEALREVVEIANLRFNATVDTLQKNAWYEVAKIANNALANAPDMDDGRKTETNGSKRAIVEVAVENSDGKKVVFTVPYSEKQCSMDYETNMPEFEKRG